MIISSDFDGGNIEVVSVNDPKNIRLNIRRDNNSEFYQWFYFRVANVRGEAIKISIENAGGAAYVEGFEDYRVCYSYDLDRWFRHDTSFDGETLSWSFVVEHDFIYFAYFAPYPMERHYSLLTATASDARVRHCCLGHTLDGQPLDMLTLGTGAKKVWLHARQHPGETMAEYWMEGAIGLLLDPSDAIAKSLLEKATFHIIPNMNPDGSRRGHLRTNASGANLNREWKDPSLERSPEVYRVREKMHEIGVDFHLDVHGDEALPYNFIAGYEGIPSLTPEHLAKLHRYMALLDAISPDFQREYGYPIDEPNSSDLRKCTDYVAETFGALAMTLEMPFKDNANAPDREFGWSPDRCRKLGMACMDALNQMIDEI